jgi:hypothetical protein
MIAKAAVTLTTIESGIDFVQKEIETKIETNCEVDLETTSAWSAGNLIENIAGVDDKHDNGHHYCLGLGFGKISPDFFAFCHRHDMIRDPMEVFYKGLSMKKKNDFKKESCLETNEKPNLSINSHQTINYQDLLSIPKSRVGSRKKMHLRILGILLISFAISKRAKGFERMEGE